MNAALLPAIALTASLEVGVEAYSVTQELGDWRSLYVRGVQRAADDVWNAEVVHGEAFRDEGTYASLAWTRTWHPHWFTQFAAGGGTGEFFFPRVRLDGLVNYKVGTQLVLTAGLGYVTAKDAHRDRSLYAGATYYLPGPLVLQTGVRWNESRPGDVRSSSGLIALTYGTEGTQYVVGRLGFGREAYQLVTADRALVDFASRSALVSWKRWLARNWGFHAGVERYSNVLYRRTGGRLGFFREF